MSASSTTTTLQSATLTSLITTSTNPTSSTPLTSDTPFFPDPSTIVPPSSSQNTDNYKGDLAKMVLEWLFLVIALCTLGFVIAWRFYQLRAHNRPLTEFFSVRRSSQGSTGGIRSVPRTTGLPRVHLRMDPNSPHPHTYYPYLIPPASAYTTTHHHQHNQRTRGADVDAYGRRIGGGGGDYDDLGDKDELPAYEHGGGPPKYMDLEMGNVNGNARAMFTGTGFVSHHASTPASGEPNNTTAYPPPSSPSPPLPPPPPAASGEPPVNTSIGTHDDIPIPRPDNNTPPTS